MPITIDKGDKPMVKKGTTLFLVPDVSKFDEIPDDDITVSAFTAPITFPLEGGRCWGTGKDPGYYFDDLFDDWAVIDQAMPADYDVDACIFFGTFKAAKQCAVEQLVDRMEELRNSFSKLRKLTRKDLGA